MFEHFKANLPLVCCRQLVIGISSPSMPIKVSSSTEFLLKTGAHIQSSSRRTCNTLKENFEKCLLCDKKIKVGGTWVGHTRNLNNIFSYII